MNKDYKKPNKFDRNLVVLGAGSAGLVTAYIAAAVKAKVSLIEKNKMGGDCLYTGCVHPRHSSVQQNFLLMLDAPRNLDLNLLMSSLTLQMLWNVFNVS